VTLPIKGLFRARADVDAEAAKERLAQARYDQVSIAIQKQIDSARAILNGAREIAANTPSELAAASATQRQDTARYQAGWPRSSTWPRPTEYSRRPKWIMRSRE